MSSRATRLLLGVALVLAVVGLSWAARRWTARPASGARPSAPARAPAPSPTPVDVRSLRDIFRFADAEPGPEKPASAPASRQPAEELEPARPGAVAAPAAAGPRLVGIVRRGDSLLAALAFEGEVELAAAGQSTRGADVLEVGAESTRVRLRDGTETTLVVSE